MLAVTDTLRLLHTYCDLLRLLGLLPIIWHVKFGRLFSEQEKARQASAVAQARSRETPSNESTPATSSTAPKPTTDKAEINGMEEVPEYTPPLWVLFLLLAAEVIAAINLFDRKDKQVVRAVGAIVRIQNKKQTGLAAMLTNMEKLIKDVDVYELIRFSASFGGLSSLFVTAWLGSKQLDFFALEANPLRNIHGRIMLLIRGLWMPRFWFTFSLIAAFGLGNWTLLSKFFERQVTKELMQAAVGLLRALATTGIALKCTYTGPMPVWAVFQSAEAVVRATCVFLHQRVPWDELLDGGIFAQGGRAVVTSVQTTLLMEAWCFLILLPCAFKRRRMQGLLPLLVAPCVMLVTGSPANALSMLETYMTLTTQRIALTVGLMSLLMLFMGGFSIMFMYIALAQILIRIHHLDSIKF